MNIATIATMLRNHVRQAPWWILLILGVVTIGNLVSIVAIDVHPDEAYYWAWSVYPDASYVDHPPMVAWMIWLVGKVAGINIFTLRLPALVSWVVAIFCVYKISEKHYSDSLYGWLAVAIYSMLPVFQAAAHIVTPDSPLLLFTALTYYFLFNAVVNGTARSWLLAGMMTGLGLLSKYNAVLMPLIVFIGMMITTEGRKQMKRSPPWAAIIVAGILFLPVVYWNYKNDWISFSFQLGHGVGAEFKLENVGIFLGGQLGAALIWMMLLMVVASVRCRALFTGKRKTYQAILISGFWIPLLFFGYAAGTTVGQVNWPAMAYYPGTILLAGMLGRIMTRHRDPAGIEKDNQRARLIVAALLIFSCLFSVTIVNIFRFPIQAKRIGLGILPTNTQLSDTYGWSELKNRIQDFRKRHHLDPECRVYLATRYMWGSMIYRFRDIDRYALLPGNKYNQYSYWVSEKKFSDREPCLVIERLEPGKANYPRELELDDLGAWLLTDTLVTPTSDTPRIYGFYLPEVPLQK